MPFSNRILAASVLALCLSLTALLAAPAANAERRATKAERAAIKRVVLKAKICRPSPVGDCRFKGARVSTFNARYVWADVFRDGLSGALLKRPSTRSRRFRIIGTQGGGIGECSYWRDLAPAGVLRDLDISGLKEGSYDVENCGKLR